MATTTLFVEILVIGATLELWLSGLLVLILGCHQAAEIVVSLTSAKELLPILAVVALAMTYALGWIFNFFAERLFRLFGQRAYRQQPFELLQVNYDTAKARVLQGGAEAIIYELRMDRHIIRVARASVINFAALALVLFGSNDLALGIRITLGLVSATASVGAFFQWLTRYRAYYRFVAQSYEALMYSRAPSA